MLRDLLKLIIDVILVEVDANAFGALEEVYPAGVRRISVYPW